MASSPENSPSQVTPTSPAASSDSSSYSPPPPSNDNSRSDNSSYSPPPPDDSNSSSSNSPPSSNSSPSSNDNSHSDSSYPPPDDSSHSSQGQGQESTPPPPDDSSHSSDSGYDSPPAPRSNGNNNTHDGGSSNTPVPPKNNNNNSNSKGKPLPSSHGGSSNDDSSSQAAPANSGKKSDESSSNNGAVIGVTVGAALLLAVVILFLTLCCRKKRKKKKLQQQQQQQQQRYYDYGAPNSKGTGDHQYYMGQQQAPWQTSFSPDGMLKPPMPHSGMAGSPATGWGAQPHMSGGSGEMSSNFSGPHRAPMPPPSPALALGFSKSTFSYEELAAATNGFSNTNLLGQGGFGYVHKGVLPNGKEIAVKSLKSGSGQGEREFQAEVEIISRVHHRHLVSLVGYCIAGGQRMLVYEFVPNNTLEYHLHGKHLAVMDFQTRLRIALGSAKGLAYLHEDCHPKIIHRDIKAANILIENDFEAKVADFGLAKLSSDNFTHVSTRVMGTFGYLAPEYASSGKLTEKSDVFSFGVMLLELATGKQPVDHTNAMDEGLVDWARPLLSQCLEEGNFDPIADPMLERNYNPQEMARLVGCAAAAIRHSAKKRPKMSQIVRALEGESSLDDLNEGVKPGQSTVFGPGGGTEYSKNSYDADMQRFRQLALASGEVNSGDYSSNDSRDMTPKHIK